MWAKEFEHIRLMIAMENEQMRDGFKTIARRGGADIVTAVGNHRDCVAALQTAPYNMFLVEDVFPDQGGINLVRYIRLIAGPMSYAPVILGIKQPSRETIIEARDAGANAITVLPMNAQTFTKIAVSLRDKPADFVVSATYNGPDRRKKDVPITHTDRRTEPAKLLPGDGLVKKLFTVNS